MRAFRSGLKAAALAAAVALLAGQLPARQSPPNIVLILADDLGWTDLGSYVSRFYETPHIDRLAEQGMRFTAAYTSGPNCAPTRASLMTGQYGPRTGVYTVGTGARGEEQHRRMIPVENETELPLQVKTLADALKTAGYATGMFGKWHLGQEGAHHPGRRGFDEAVESMGRHFNFRTNPTVPATEGEYLAEFLAGQAERFIEKNRDRPFFLYLSHFAVHTPLEARPETVSRYERRTPAGGHSNPVYAAMIEHLDRSVGRVTAKLEALGLSRNTVVIFSSDNGGVGGYREAGLSRARDITDNAPLRGGKGMLYEGGVRVPLIVRWPAKVEAGSVAHQPVTSVDFLPTLLGIAGGALPDQPLDGESLLPILESAGKASLRREALYWHFPGYLEAGRAGGEWRTTPAGAIRSGDFKLIEFFEDGRIELYNVAEDVGERRDLAGTMPEKAQEMHRKLRAWRHAIGAPMPKMRDVPRDQALRSLVDAERAFARTSVERGVREAFLANLAGEAILFRPGPVNGRQWFLEQPAPGYTLSWEPVFADVSSAGDLGFTTGPWTLGDGPGSPPRLHGNYATVWKRQSDGGWKLVIDHGNPNPPPPVPTPALSSPEASAWKPDQPIDPASERARLLELDRSPSGSRMHEQARFLRNGQAPLVGPAAVGRFLESRAGRSEWSPMGGEVSRGADLGYVYGSYVFTGRDGAAEKGHYLRIWRRMADGAWGVILDLAVPDP